MRTVSQMSQVEQSEECTYHDFDRKAGLDELRGGVSDVLGGVVRALSATTEDDVNVGVALGLNDGGETLLADGKEDMAGARSAAGVNCDAD